MLLILSFPLTLVCSSALELAWVLRLSQLCDSIRLLCYDATEVSHSLWIITIRTISSAYSFLPFIANGEWTAGLLRAPSLAYSLPASRSPSHVQQALS